MWLVLSAGSILTSHLTRSINSMRHEIGRQAKRVLDYGRLKYLEEVTNLDIQLKYYVDPFISLENALIVCSRPGTTG